LSDGLIATSGGTVEKSAIWTSISGIWTSVRSLRPGGVGSTSGRLRAIGTTPGQSVTAVLVAHLVACLLACALGIPLGIALYNAIRGALDPIALTPLTYIATGLAALMLYTAIAFIPARLLARRPVTPQLAYE
jgi:hypothetical protein